MVISKGGTPVSGDGNAQHGQQSEEVSERWTVSRDAAHLATCGSYEDNLLLDL